MKKSFLFSLIIHSLLFIGVSLLIAILQTDKKTELKKIAIYLPPMKKLEPVQQQAIPILKQTSMTKAEPVIVPSQPQSPLLSKTIQPLKIPNDSVSVAIPEKVQVNPVQKTLEVAVPIAKLAQIYKAPVEPKSDPKIKEEYISYIRQTIDERKIYPKNAKRLRQSGTVNVKFTILDDGTIKGVSVINSSGFELLDNAASDLLVTVGKVRAIPKEIAKDSLELTIP
ncbi:energy transducer TonB, partial [Sulfuricurvum sp.]|uniref:energy transducer TonB n=1 Tax=Sulfuricurvum sp. TaxID=2025608 RepID=UPI003BB79F2A